jgi:hypothetical protein
MNQPTNQPSFRNLSHETPLGWGESSACVIYCNFFLASLPLHLKTCLELDRGSKDFMNYAFLQTELTSPSF